MTTRMYLNPSIKIFAKSKGKKEWIKFDELKVEDTIYLDKKYEPFWTNNMDEKEPEEIQYTAPYYLITYDTYKGMFGDDDSIDLWNIFINGVYGVYGVCIEPYSLFRMNALPRDSTIPHYVIEAPPTRVFSNESDTSINETKYTMYIDPDEEILVDDYKLEWRPFGELESCTFICFDENNKPIFKKDSIEKKAKNVPYKYKLTYFFVSYEDYKEYHYDESHGDSNTWNCYIDNGKNGAVYGLYLDDSYSLYRNV